MLDFIMGIGAGFIFAIALLGAIKRNLAKNAVVINMDNLFDLGNIRRRYYILLTNSNVKTNLEKYMHENYCKTSVILSILLKCLKYQANGYKLFFYSPDYESLHHQALQLLDACGLKGTLTMNCKEARFLVPNLKKYNIIDII